MKRYLCCFFVLALATSGLAQDPRDFCVQAEFCPPGVDCCSDDLLEVQFLDGAAPNGSTLSNLGMGDTFRVAVTIDVRSGDPEPGATTGIQGWSYAVRHDTSVLTIDSVESGDDVDWRPIFSGGFEVTVSAFGGPDRTTADAGIGQAVVLSFVSPRRLPPNQDDFTLVFADYTVAADIPAEGTKIEFAQGELATASGGPPVEVNLTVAGETKVPTQLVDALALGAEPVECADYAFYFGDAATTDNLEVAGNSFLISMRNVQDASAFELAVKNDGGSLSFVSGEIGDGPDNLRELIITGVDSLSHVPTELNTASISDDIGSGERIGATADTGVQDFFVVQTSPLVGEGLFAGYVADLTASQAKVIPATGAADPCPVNQILKINLGDVALPEFRRGDVNDDDKHNVTDGVIIVKEIFGLDNPGIDCAAAYDANNNNGLAIDDAIYLLNWIFRRGEALADPFMTCGTDEDDTLGCEESNCP